MTVAQQVHRQPRPNGLWETILGTGDYPPDHAEVYSQYGYAVHCYQRLETAIRAALESVESRTWTTVELERLLAGEDKRTMGTLLTELRKRGQEGVALADALKPALDSRNRIVHRFFLEPNVMKALSTQSGRELLVDELHAAARDTEQLTRGLVIVLALAVILTKRNPLAPS